MATDYQKPIRVSFSMKPLPAEKVWKRLGYAKKEKRVNPEINRLLDEEMDRIQALIQPAGIYRLLQIKSRSSEKITFQNNPFVIESVQVARLLKESDPVVLFMVTIGPALEHEVESLISKGEITRGVILDAIGSEMAESCANQLHWDILDKTAGESGFRVTARFSPGYGDWPVTIQREIARTCGGSTIGIVVTESSMMIPRKSVSAVLGFTALKPK